MLVGGFWARWAGSTDLAHRVREARPGEPGNPVLIREEKMTKAIFLLLAISLVGIPAYGQVVIPGGTTVPGSGLQTPPPQVQSSPLPWDTVTLKARGMSPQAGFRVPVTVRTGPGETISAAVRPGVLRAH